MADVFAVSPPWDPAAALGKPRQIVQNAHFSWHRIALSG